jgi:hypothetical protein
MLPAYRFAIEEGRLDDVTFMEELHQAHRDAFERFSNGLATIINELE